MLQGIDLEKLHRLTAENSDANEIISQLLENHKFIVSKISHEIRNPLTIIHSTLQLLESQHPDLESYKYWPE
ncbi:MAG: two-component sensor histidine kinase, partial [Lachnospiraceae bacterium]